MEQRLKGQVAIVTGASRGAGRGIAAVLGEAGATVYITGRSSRHSSTTQNRTETIEETADMVRARGGVGIPVRCDHTVDADVAALFDRVRKEQGRLDLLVNNVWGGYADEMDKFSFPFWKQPDRWDAMFHAGVRAHLNASRLAVPLMLPQGRGLIINTTFYDQGHYSTAFRRDRHVVDVLNERRYLDFPRYRRFVVRRKGTNYRGVLFRRRQGYTPGVTTRTEFRTTTVKIYRD